MEAERLDQAPPDDGLTIDGNTADAAEIGMANDVPLDERLPPSRLDHGLQFDVLKKLFLADADHSSGWRAEAKEAFAFRAGDQWSAEDRALLDGQNRPHIVFNRVLTILKAVAGMEINGRHEISYLPRGTEDTKANEVLSAASKWMSDMSDGEDEESQAFDHTTTCGMGWCEERMSFEDDPRGLYVEENTFPLEMYWDRKARKKNLSDAKRMARARRMSIGDAMDLFPGKNRYQLDAAWASSYAMEYPLKSIEEKRKRDDDNTPEGYDDHDEVTIVHMQWIEHETYYLVADEATQTTAELTLQQHRRLTERLKALGMPPVTAAKLRRKVFKQAFLGGQLLKPAHDAPIKGQFSWKCITGEFDASTRTWFGLVRVMRDPQMWANKWLSQILHILNSTAKGGILAEVSAFDDQRQAEQSYAQPEGITWLADGSLSGDKPRIIPKPGTGMSDGYVGLLAFAISSIKDVTGINLELLGQQDQNQPGVIEAMRKQAGMTILATLFDSLRRFRKQVGRSRLFFIQNYLSDGRLIRVVGDGTADAQAVALAREKTTGEYDVVIDDAPTSPNQKEATWAVIQPMLVVFKDQLVAQPKVLAMLLEYSPLPARVVQAISAFVAQAEQDPEAQQQKQLAQQTSVALLENINAKTAKEQSIAMLNQAKAGNSQIDSVLNQAMAQNLIDDNQRAQISGIFEAMEAEANAEKAKADAEAARARATRETAAIGTDRLDAITRSEEVQNKRGQSRVGHLIDMLTADDNRLITESTAARNFAAARKDMALARNGGRAPARTS